MRECADYATGSHLNLVPGERCANGTRSVSNKSDDLQSLKLRFPRSVCSDIILITYGRVS